MKTTLYVLTGITTSFALAYFLIPSFQRKVDEVLIPLLDATVDKAAVRSFHVDCDARSLRKMVDTDAIQTIEDGDFGGVDVQYEAYES